MKKYRIKPKPYIEATINSIASQYTKLCSLEKRPYITFSRAEVKRMGLKRYSNLAKRYLGMAWVKSNVIYISPRLQMEEAKKTLAHEFIHLRFPYMGHTSKFDELVKRLLDGEQFEPYKSKRK